MHSKFHMPNLCHRLLAMPVAPYLCKTSLVTLLLRNCGNNDQEIKQNVRKQVPVTGIFPLEGRKKKKGIYKCILEIYWLNKCVSRYPELRLREQQQQNDFVLLTDEIPSAACVVAVTLCTESSNLLLLLILSAPPEYFWGYVA